MGGLSCRSFEDGDVEAGGEILSEKGRKWQNPPSATVGVELFVDDQLYTEICIDLCLFCASPFKY